MSRILAFALTLAAAFPLQAADTQFYLGAGAGVASSKAPLNTPSLCPEVCIPEFVPFPAELGSDTASEAALKIVAGGRFGRYLGIELSYTDFQTSHYATTFSGTGNRMTRDADFNALTMFLVGYLPVHRNVELYAKAGPTRGKTSGHTEFFGAAVDIPLISVPVPFHDRDSGVALGVGAQARLGQLAVRLELEDHDVDFLKHSDTVMLGATWTFDFSVRE